MRRHPVVVLLAIVGAFAAAGAWGVRESVVVGRLEPEEGLRVQQAAIVDVEAWRLPPELRSD
jgi:hypothetical protein